MFDDWAARPTWCAATSARRARRAGIRYLVDPRVARRHRVADRRQRARPARDRRGAGRDFTPDGTIEAAEVRAGDPCPACGEVTLTMRRGIEIGHIFQLGRRYTDAFEVDALGADGKPVRPTMGCYGIGISRAVAAIAEQHHDERGLVWPAAIAPADVHVVAAGKDDQVDGGARARRAAGRRGPAGAGRRPRPTSRPG